MAKITTITNPLTGQPVQVDQLEHTAQQIDDGIGFESTDYPGCYYRMVGSVVEWFNPPMLLGVEYRTTERHLGEPVYVKAVGIGNLPNTTVKLVEYTTVTSVRPISVTGQSSNNTIPVQAWWGNSTYVSLQGVGNKIYIKTDSDFSAYSAIAVVKYYKTTD